MDDFVAFMNKRAQKIQKGFYDKTDPTHVSVQAMRQAAVQLQRRDRADTFVYFRAMNLMRLGIFRPDDIRAIISV